MQKENDDVGFEALNLALVGHEIKWHFAEIEFQGEWIVFLDFICPYKKLPAFLSEPSREIIVIRDPVMKDLIRDEKNALHEWMRVNLSRNVFVTHEPQAEQAEEFTGMLPDFHQVEDESMLPGQEENREGEAIKRQGYH